MVKWEETLCSCFEAKGYCCLVLLLPFCYPVFQGCTVKKATGQSWIKACMCPFFLCCIGASLNRAKIRNRYLIEGSCCEDCLVHCFCSLCAICQEHIEVRNRERM